MGLRRAVAALLAALAIVAGATGRPAGAAIADPVLVLVSIDGFRWDYASRYPTPNLRLLASRGVRAKAMIPSFPVLTFPNHYTIVTGLYPEHHGIVANVMNDPENPVRFSMSNREAVRDSRWWGGEPIWVTAARQGRRTAAMFWPGSEADIRGFRPTYWKPFDGELPASERTAQVLEWLRLPEDKQPAFVALYFDDVDHAGHDFGPDSSQLKAAVAAVDREIGRLVDGLRRLHLEERTTVVVVSDHGMAPLSPSRQIVLDDYIDVGTVNVTETGGFLALAPREGVDAGRLAAQLAAAHPRLHVYTRENIPPRLHYSNSPRIAPIVGIPDVGWSVTTRGARQRRHDEGRLPQVATHGFDPAETIMHAIFVAKGPDVAHGLVVPPFENVHLYNFLCAVLGLTPAPNDGDPARVSAWLQRSH